MNVFVLNTKEDILKKVRNRAVLDHSIVFPTMEMPQNSRLTNFLQNIFICVQNKHIHAGLEILEAEEMMTEFVGELSL